VRDFYSPPTTLAGLVNHMVRSNLKELLPSRWVSGLRRLRLEWNRRWQKL
jgi:hypothetical protein